MAAREDEFYDSDDDTSLVVKEVLGQHLDPRLSFNHSLGVPYLDRHEVTELRDRLNEWLGETEV